MLDNNTTEPPISHRDIAHLASAIEALTSVVNELRVEISQTYVRKDVLDPQLVDIKADIQGHQDWLTWGSRIIIALVIVTVVGAAFKMGG
jgi:hypothetical protein